MKNDIEYSLKKATFEDCNLIFEWANDKAVRENSFNSDAIKYSDHVKWFNKRLESNDSCIYIFEVNKDKVGMIRLDKLDANSYLINYSISRDYRQKGYATTLLEFIKDKYKSNILIGKVKATNIGSIKAFIGAGYIMKEEAEIKVFYSMDNNC